MAWSEKRSDYQTVGTPQHALFHKVQHHFVEDRSAHDGTIPTKLLARFGSTLPECRLHDLNFRVQFLV